MDYWTEPLARRMILAVSSEGLAAQSRHSGFLPASEREAFAWLHRAGLWIGPRDALEEMPAYRQIIPYVALRVGDRYVKYARMPAGGEPRLHGRISIGLGGHVDLSDVVVRANSVDLAATLGHSVEREVREELNGVSCDSKTWLGLLVDNESSVGRVHLGVVAVWTLNEAPTGSSEAAIGSIALATIDELRAEQKRLETWSALLVEHLAAVAGAHRSFDPP
jgi:predicted NUDIX family phosphoesterase